MCKINNKLTWRRPQGEKKKEFIIGWSWYSFDPWSSDTFYLMVWGLKHFIQIYIHFTRVTLQSFYASIAFAVYWEGRVRKETEDHNSKKKNLFASYCTNPKETFSNNHGLLGPTCSQYIPQMLAVYLTNIINQSQ